MKTWYVKIRFTLLWLELFVAAIDFLQSVVPPLLLAPLQHCPNSMPITALIPTVGKSFWYKRNQACRPIAQNDTWKDIAGNVLLDAPILAWSDPR